MRRDWNEHQTTTKSIAASKPIATSASKPIATARLHLLLTIATSLAGRRK